MTGESNLFGIGQALDAPGRPRSLTPELTSINTQRTEVNGLRLTDKTYRFTVTPPKDVA